MENLREAQLEMLDILKEIDCICEKHKIRYWLFAGTLLGAVRHQGFIPWDDDCDIGMMREDFEKFESVLNELPSHLFYQTPKTDPHYTKKFIKIRSNRIKLIETEESFNEPYHQGVFVDIFIHDYYPSWSLSLMKYLQRFYLLRKQKVRYQKGSLQRMFFHLRLLPEIASHYFVRFVLNILLKKFRKKTSGYIGIALSYADFKAVYHAEHILPISEKMTFEGSRFSVPKDADALLCQCFGNYMQLPPEGERRWHAKAIVVNKDEKIV